VLGELPEEGHPYQSEVELYQGEGVAGECGTGMGNGTRGVTLAGASGERSKTAQWGRDEVSGRSRRGHLGRDGRRIAV
jgi:hypothetical protein